MVNNAKPLTMEEQIQLRNKAKDELERLLGLISDMETKKIIDDFKEKFSICEIVYKVVLEYHQYIKTGEHKNRLEVKMTQVPFALDYAGYNFEKRLLTILFGAEEKVGIRSFKKLRDSLTHSMNQTAVDELLLRNNDLHGYMDAFLEKIRKFDNAV